MSLDIHGAPARACRCPACRGKRRRIFARLSDPQLRALRHLHRTFPRQPGDVRARARVRPATLRSLLRPARGEAFALAAEIRLHRFTNEPALPFLLLSDLGRDVTEQELCA